MANIKLSEKNISLDFQHQGFVNTIYAQQGDVNSRQLVIKLFDDGKEYTIPSGSKIYLVGLRGDGCSIQKREVDSFSGNTATVIFKDEELAAKGTCKYKLMIEGGASDILSTSSFKIKVYENVYTDDGLIPTPQFSKLTEELNRIDGVAGKIENVNIEAIQDVNLYKIKLTDREGRTTITDNLYATLSIGDVEKDENASATITGGFGNQKLNLKLPKGDKGDKGDKGEPGSIDNVSANSIHYSSISDTQTVKDVVDTKITSSPAVDFASVSNPDFIVFQNAYLSRLSSIENELNSLKTLVNSLI